MWLSQVAGLTFKVSRKFEGQQAAILEKLRTHYDQITAAEAERPGGSDAMLGGVAVSCRFSSGSVQDHNACVHIRHAERSLSSCTATTGCNLASKGTCS